MKRNIWEGGPWASCLFIFLFLSLPVLFPVSQADYAHASETQERTKPLGDVLLVNKEHRLPSDYEGSVDLVEAKNSMGRPFLIERETYRHFLELQGTMKKQGIQIEMDSVYRSVARQREIVEEFTDKYGEDYVRKYVAVPEYSEHHTGLSVDICLVVDGKVVDDNDEMLAQREIFQRIHRELANHGFILRYPKGKESVTGYSYEPWHFRYVGKDIAVYIADRGLTLEEYAELLRLPVVERPISWSSRREKLAREYALTHYGNEQTEIVPMAVVVHWTATGDGDAVYRYFNEEVMNEEGNETLQVSSQFLVDRDGTIFRLTPETKLNRHAIGYNWCAIGIENVGGVGGKEDLTEAQLSANVRLIRCLHAKYPSIRYVFGHYQQDAAKDSGLYRELVPDYYAEKTDPGPVFMQGLSEALGKDGLIFF